MAAPIEVVVSSEISGQMWNSCVWDPHNGTTLTTYKGGSSAPRTLGFLGKDYIISGVNNHPLIHVWALHRQEQQQMRIVCPGLVTALATSPCGNYCAAGIAERIHVWHVSTGKLVAILSRHYQNITCLKFTDDGSCLISGGNDSLVLVWSMASILQSHNGISARLEPLYVSSNHSLPVTDIYCGCGGPLARVVSSSLDQTCRLWDLSSGQELCCFVYDVSITSVTMDTAEYRLFAGGINGSIYQINLFSQEQVKGRVVISESETADDEGKTQTFVRHSKQVNCLSVSIDGTMLLSGSHDCTVVLWDIASRQCIRVLNHKGIVTNAMFTQAPIQMFSTVNKTAMPIKPFQRSSQTDSDGKTHSLDMRIKHSIQLESEDMSVTQRRLQECLQGMTDTDRVTTSQLQEECRQLQTANKNLFKFAVKELLTHSQS
ncbi:WD repeat-containing protein 18-like isoform X1 [Ptychodera flava]|uniref:WD repeat-containing protein 18-like isoform X1 n=1 Tax=Ptychodera flava TaxID=63121 RepID=UPI003969FA62